MVGGLTMVVKLKCVSLTDYIDVWKIKYWICFIKPIYLMKNLNIDKFQTMKNFKSYFNYSIKYLKAFIERHFLK